MDGDEPAIDAALARQSDFQAESDPLFFKWQRGEVEQQVWLDKVTEIRARYPEPTQ